MELNAELISSFLGYAIVLGSVSLKLPQIMNILRAGSAQGVSESTTFLELLIFATSYFYGYVKKMPIETYAENGICGVQVLLLYVLLMAYNGKMTSLARYLVLASCGAYAYAFITGEFSREFEGRAIYEWLYLAVVPLGVISKVPQIITFYSEGSTGNAAFATWFLGFGGSAARVFTTMTQVGDPVMLLAYSLNSVFGGIIVLQFIYYWGVKPKEKTA